MADDLKHRGTQEIDDFYRSSNGDRWRLVRARDTGHRTVRHEPNLSSGGRVTETPLEEWLDRTGASPENSALRSLLERLDAAGRTECVATSEGDDCRWSTPRVRPERGAAGQTV
jgi:hypothetical protein